MTEDRNGPCPRAEGAPTETIIELDAFDVDVEPDTLDEEVGSQTRELSGSALAAMIEMELRAAEERDGRRFHRTVLVHAPRPPAAGLVDATRPRPLPQVARSLSGPSSMHIATPPVRPSRDAMLPMKYAAVAVIGLVVGTAIGFYAPRYGSTLAALTARTHATR